jgi:hypothetical protein
LAAGSAFSITVRRGKYGVHLQRGMHNLRPKLQCEQACGALS